MTTDAPGAAAPRLAFPQSSVQAPIPWQGPAMRYSFSLQSSPFSNIFDATNKEEKEIPWCGEV